VQAADIGRFHRVEATDARVAESVALGGARHLDITPRGLPS
jgi:hypothetical protein